MIRTRFACLLAAASLSACGGGGGSSPPAAPVTAGDEVRFLIGYLGDWYLWYRDLPALDASRYDSAESALAALKVAQDRFSFIDSAQTFNALFDDARALGYGVAYAPVGSEVWVRYTQPSSNAGTGGLRRGDRILSIDDVPVATLIAQGRLDAAFGPATEGVTGRFRIQRGTTSFDLTLVKGWYTLTNVLVSQILANGPRKVGYLLYLSFNDPSRAEWQTALGALLDAGAQDLVVDLRENGGGRLTVANELISSLAPAGLVGQTALTLQFNDRHQDSNQTFSLTTPPNTGRPDRLVWITSPRTCSAAEAMISALRPYRAATLVGETSCGKPVGFTPPVFNGKVYNIVDFQLRNRDGFTDYFNGLAPDCAAPENYALGFGDPAEPKLAAALQWLGTGSCPVTAAKTAPAAPAVTTAPAHTLRSLEDLTGLR